MSSCSPMAMRFAASLLGSTQSVFGVKLSHAHGDTDMVSMIKSCDIDITTMQENDNDITVITGRSTENVSGKIVLIIDATVKTQRIACDELYILGKSKVTADVITAQTLVVWASLLKAEYISAKCGHIAVDTFDVGKMKSGIKVYGHGKLSYNWREMTDAVKEMLESLNGNDDIDCDEIEKFVAADYGTSGPNRTIKLSDEDDDDTAIMREEILDQFDEAFSLCDEDPAAKAAILKLLRSVQHQELREILKNMVTDPSSREDSVDDLIFLLSDEDDKEKVEEELYRIGELCADHDALAKLAAEWYKAQAAPTPPQAQVQTQQTDPQDVKNLTDEYWDLIEQLTNKELETLITEYMPADIFDAGKGKSKAVLLSEISMLAHVDSGFVRHAITWLDAYKAKSWEETKADSSTIHSESIAEAQTKTDAENNETVEGPDSTPSAETKA